MSTVKDKAGERCRECRNTFELVDTEGLCVWCRTLEVPYAELVLQYVLARNSDYVARGLIEDHGEPALLTIEIIEALAAIFGSHSLAVARMADVLKWKAGTL